VCPWFPYEGTIDLKTWEKVGQRLKDHYTSEGPTYVPVDAFSSWNLFRDFLDSQHEVITISSFEVEISKQEVDVQTSLFVSLSDLNLPPLNEFLNPPHDDDSDVKILSPEEEEELEEQAAQYHHHSPQLLKLLKSLFISKPAVSTASSKSPQVFPVTISGSNSSLSPLQKGMRGARQVGEDMREFCCFPVRVQNNQRFMRLFLLICLRN
jgi:hypothetical protein